VPITGVMVAKHKNTKHNRYMESTSTHDPSVPKEITPKHDPPLARVYEWFLDLPVPIVLAVMWLVGTVLIGACGLALYYSWLSLPAPVAGG
jgi:hypothetical protein